jgi:hypothetical protein
MIDLGAVRAVYFVQILSLPPLSRVDGAFRESSVSGRLVHIDFDDGGGVEGWLVAETPGLGSWVVPEDPECNSLRILVPENASRTVAAFGSGDLGQSSADLSNYAEIGDAQVLDSQDLPLAHPETADPSKGLDWVLGEYAASEAESKPLSAYDLTERPEEILPLANAGLSPDARLAIPGAGARPAAGPPIPQARTVLAESSEAIPISTVAQPPPAESALDVLLDAPYEQGPGSIPSPPPPATGDLPPIVDVPIEEPDEPLPFVDADFVISQPETLPFDDEPIGEEDLAVSMAALDALISSLPPTAAAVPHPIEVSELPQREADGKLSEWADPWEISAPISVPTGDGWTAAFTVEAMLSLAPPSSRPRRLSAAPGEVDNELRAYLGPGK